MEIDKHQIEKKLKEINNCIIQEDVSSNLLSIASGEIGKLIFQFNYSKHFQDKNTYEHASKRLFYIIDEFQNSSEISLSFMDGLSGLYWFLALYNDVFFEFDEEFLSDNDVVNILFDFYLNNINCGDYDYMHGALGGVLGLNRQKEINSLNFEISLANFFQKYNIPKSYTDGRNVINFGLSHGIPSIISVISIYSTSSFSHIVPLIKYLEDIYYKNLERKEITSFYSIFPNFITENNLNQTNSRLAWCYGDLGVAIAFWHAGNKLENNKWKEIAIDILLYNSQRKDLKTNGIVDAGLCHGASGVAHIFNRFYLETEIMEFDEARRYWLSQTLQMDTFKDGIAGYKSYKLSGYQNDSGLLEGSAGIGLSLLGFLKEDIGDLKWDSCLLLS